MKVELEKRLNLSRVQRLYVEIFVEQDICLPTGDDDRGAAGLASIVRCCFSNCLLAFFFFVRRTLLEPFDFFFLFL